VPKGREQVTLIDVIVPGPWWNPLTYEHEEAVPAGNRVQVPVGPAKRVGFSLGVSSVTSNKSGAYRIRTINKVLDTAAPLPRDLWILSRWIGVNFYCGQGEALRVMSPSQLMKGEEVPPAAPWECLWESRAFKDNYYYFPEDQERHARYLKILQEHPGPAILLFPERALAEFFYSFLETESIENIFLWPSVGGKKLWEAWNRTRSGEHKIIIGGPGAIFAPLPDPQLILVDEESSPAYRMQAAPLLHIRSIAMQRARIANSSLFLCGRLPSSKVSLYKMPEEHGTSMGNRLIFVDMNRASRPSFPGITSSFPLSDALVRESMSCLKERKAALWILDRKGYAGEITCEECGGTLICHSCGVALRAEEEASRLVCPLCGYSTVFPRECPKCRGLLLSGKRPGLEIVYKVAQALCGEAFPVVEWHAEKNTSKKAFQKVCTVLAGGGIVVGSRAAISLCDAVNVGMVGWIDADAEARKILYRSRFDAYRMVLESAWRGTNPSERKVVIQSRRPGSGWQRGLKYGWKAFWRRELKEREEYGFPPFNMLAEITPPSGKKEALLQYLVDENLTIMDPGGEQNSLWAFIQRPQKLKKALEPWFNISKSREGFPSVSLWID
jgi:primosomal protein N' (replication factor Y)